MKGGKCGEFHSRSVTYVNHSNNVSATVNPEDYSQIVANLQSAVCIDVARRVACPAHDSKMWSNLAPKTNWIKKVLTKIFTWIVTFFYLILPPYPPLIIKKAMFCSPPRGYYYFLVGEKNGKKVPCFYAKDAVQMERLSICLPQMINTRIRAIDVFYHLLRCKVKLLPYEETKHIVAMELFCEQSVRWLHRNTGVRRVRSPNLIIFSQPNSSDIGCCLMMDPNFADIADFLYCDMLIYDYAGYGVSDGTTSEKVLYASAEAVIEYAVNGLGYTTDQIILIGFSLGTAASIHLASKYKVAALVLIAPFASFLKIILGCTKTNFSVDMFPSYIKSTSITCPTLICHGQNDAIVSHKHGIALQACIPNCELYLMKASHQGIFCERSMWDRVEEFLHRKVGITKKWIDCIESELTFNSSSLSRSGLSTTGTITPTQTTTMTQSAE